MTKSSKLDSTCKVQNCSPQTPISCGGLVVSKGIDTIHLVLDILQTNPSLFVDLQNKKKEVQSGNAMHISFDFGQSGIFAWNLQRMGSKLYPYVLKNGDITLSLSTRQVNSTIPNAMLMIGSISCNNDLPKIMASFNRWADFAGMKIIETKVSRIDIYSDINTDIESTYVDYLKNYITRANKKALYYQHDHLTGVQIGSGDIVCRIYDKQEEMVQKQKFDKQAFFLKLWGLGVADPVTRVEFQLRRKVIKEFFKEKTDFNTVASEICGLWAYLTADWLRHCSAPVDRKNKNQQRSVDSEFWRIVVGAFDEPAKKINREAKAKMIDVTSLKKQVRGLIFSIVAAYKVQTDDFFEICRVTNQTIYKEVLQYMQTANYSSEYAIKRSRAVVSF